VVPGLALFAGVMTVIAAACPGHPVDALFSSYDGPHPGRVSRHQGRHDRVRADVRAGERRDRRACDLATNYRLALTKPFTATAIALLAERGALSVDDPVARHLPQSARAPRALTLRHLLDPYVQPARANRSYRRMIRGRSCRSRRAALVAQQPLEWAPGTRYRYNNTGYALLALVVERVSKLSYSEFLRRNIFSPLGMTATATCEPGASIPHRAYGYSGTDEQFVRADQSRTSAVLGDVDLLVDP
jgi:CubicO group peptidase (beta-lactamase class C family)